MTITRLSRARDLGIFRDFTWPSDLPDFGRYNLIYGWNWSGKTTISRVLRALETRTAPPTGQVTLSINGSDVDGSDFAEVTLAIRVFNKDFVAANVFPIGGADVPPILVVGKESVEKQKQVEGYRSDLTTAQTILDTSKLAKRSAEGGLDSYCVNQATVIRETLRSQGSNRYNTYNKTHYRNRAEKLVTDGDRNACRLGESDREKLLAQHRATSKPKLLEVTYELPELKSLANAASEVLATTVVSSAIQALKDDQEVSSWVHHGLGLHRDRHAKRCLFCEQTLPAGRLAALEDHFNFEYERFLKRLDGQISQLESFKGATTLALPNRAELYEDLSAEYEAARNSLQEVLASVEAYLASLVRVLEEKRGRVFEEVELDVIVPEADSSAIDTVLGVIRGHNQACDDFETRINTAREKLEADSVVGSLDEFKRLENAVQASETSLSRAQTAVSRLNEAIAKLELEISEHRRPAEELNEDLRKYLGHDELRLEVKDTGYGIIRCGVPADALSEGEMTAIALLYFLKTLADQRFTRTKGVVVLDDPVSSLDANALFLAFGFIRQQTQDVAQLFILTHNFTFFRQVRNWFHHLKGQNKRNIKERPARFYMLDCVRGENGRCSNIAWLDPLLEKYESEYHYLFARIYREARATTPVTLEENYVFPNMGRRLLEAFLAFRKPQFAGELWKTVEDLKYDEAKKLRILRFLNTHSHGEAIGEPEHDPSILAETRSVLTDLLDLINDQDPDHFSAMEQLAALPSDEGQNE